MRIVLRKTKITQEINDLQKNNIINDLKETWIYIITINISWIIPTIYIHNAYQKYFISNYKISENLIIGSEILNPLSIINIYYNFIIYIIPAYLITLLIIRRHRQNNQFKDLQIKAKTDPLTECLNRRAWDEMINDMISNNNHLNQDYYVIVSDLNDLKEINDKLGHDCGDDFINKMGNTLLSLSKKEDFVFRIGGDEFCVIIPLTSINISKKELKDRIKNLLLENEINTSFGIAMTSTNKDIIQTYKEADQLMLKRKKRYRDFNPDIKPCATCSLDSRVTLNISEENVANELYDSIKNNELSLVYQPIISNISSIKTFEVLMRWKKNNEYISPNIFIPLAEKTGQIHMLWDWCLENSIRQLSEWKELISPLPSISLNFSAIQIEFYGDSEYSYKNQIIKLCSKYNINPSLIRIELTETALSKDLKKAKDIFEELATIGVTLSIDDYGTGYSSLAMIQMLPVKCIKIDGRFIDGLPDSKYDRAIVKGTIALARELSISITAEHVETKEQLECLKEFGCDHYQGFYLSKPLSPEDVKTNFSSDGVLELFFQE